MKILISENLKVIIDELVADFPNDEWTMFGKTEYVNGDVRVLDLRALKQKSSSSTTEVDPEALEKFLRELKKDGENPAEWNLWMHSHNTMGAFWSGTDREQFKSFNQGQNYMVHIVVSAKGCKGAITQYKPFELENDDVTIEFEEFVLPTPPKEILKMTTERHRLYTEWKAADDIIKEWEESVKAPDKVKLEKLKKELKEANNTIKKYNDYNYGNKRYAFLISATKTHKYTCECKNCQELKRLTGEKYGKYGFDD